MPPDRHVHTLSSSSLAVLTYFCIVFVCSAFDNQNPKNLFHSIHASPDLYFVDH